MLGTTRNLFLASSLAALLLCPAAARADELGSSFLDGLIRARLVFEGVVLDVGYRLSTPTAGDPAAIPHTFVRYRIERVFKGSVGDDGRGASADTLVLRFIGGEGTDDEYLMASGLPLFDVGDRDVLMVAGNGRSICPLVRCAHGRYRLIDGYVYGEDGQEIVATADAPVVYGRFRELRDVLSHQMGAAHLQRVGVRESGESGPPRPPPDYGTHHDAESFRAIVAGTLSTLERAGLLPPQPPTPSSDPDADFVVAGPAAVRPEPEPLPKLLQASREDAITATDELEALLVRFNGGDPRLPSRAAALLNQVQKRAWTSRGSGR